MTAHSAENDVLGAFLRFADAVQAAHERGHRPAYAEICSCGGSVEVSRDVPAPERRRIRDNFLSKHQACVRVIPPEGTGA